MEKDLISPCENTEGEPETEYYMPDKDSLEELKKEVQRMTRRRRRAEKALADEPTAETPAEDGVIGHKLWSSGDKRNFFPVADTFDDLPPDVYEPRLTNQGQPFFYRVNFSTEDLIQFDDSNIDKVVEEITQFWKRKERFIDFGFPYKRGLLLWGPPGSGKSCAIKLIIKQVIEEGGIGLRFDNPSVFIRCMRTLRLIQPEVPVIAIMEDLDAIMDNHPESIILNMLDGIDGFENIVYLATTNYPQELEGRVKNRPSRFDRRFHIGFPNEKSREIYIRHLQTKTDSDNIEIDIERWVKDTKEFTFAHIKELFTSVALFENSYEVALDDLHEMRKKISSDEDEYNGGIGFRE